MTISAKFDAILSGEAFSENMTESNAVLHLCNGNSPRTWKIKKPKHCIDKPNRQICNRNTRNKTKWKTHHSPAELIEKAKHWDGFRDLEGSIASLPFANTVLCYINTLYGWERHSSDWEEWVRFELVLRWIVIVIVIVKEGLRRQSHLHRKLGTNLGFSENKGVSVYNILDWILHKLNK